MNTSTLKKLNALPFIDITLASGHNVFKSDVARALELLTAQKTGKQIQRRSKGEWVDCRITPDDIIQITTFRVKP